MKKCLLVTILASSLLSAVVVADEGSGNPMDEEYHHPMGADLGAMCQPSIPPEPCVSGSTRQTWFWNRADYCQCLDGRPMITKTRGSCSAYSQGNNYFWVNDAATNKLCACPGYGDRICTSETSVNVPGADPKNSNLKCMNNHVCKIENGDFCNPDNGRCREAGRLQQPCASAQSDSDCDYPHAGCGPVSQRCVPRSAMLQEGYLEIEATKKSNPSAVQLVAQLKSSSLHNTAFQVEEWGAQLGSTCETAGLTKDCKPSVLVVT